MAKKKELPDHAYLKECLDYDPMTGVLTWRVRPLGHFAAEMYWKAWNTKWAGRPASTIQHGRSGHLCKKISIGGERWLSARVIWKWMTGEDPPSEIDHVSRYAADDRWENLRVAERSENQRNRRCKIRPLPKGVYATRNGRRWFAHIQVNYRIVYLGTFDSPEAAHAAYRAAAAALHGEFADYGAHD